jgi:ribonuclease P/MRP protein subunit RPP40
VTSGVPQGSVLGPLLFVIFINDLSMKILNDSKLYADDTKVISIIRNSVDSNILQNDIETLVDWSNEWLIKFNESKCKVMHIGKNNEKFKYQMNNSILSETELEKDLGIFISNDLEWSQHVNTAVGKANRQLGLIKSSFQNLNEFTIKLLYKSLVRPHLEYGAAIWSPYWQYDIDKLEAFQRRATKIESLRGYSYIMRD